MVTVITEQLLSCFKADNGRDGMGGSLGAVITSMTTQFTTLYPLRDLCRMFSTCWMGIDTFIVQLRVRLELPFRRKGPDTLNRMLVMLR